MSDRGLQIVMGGLLVLLLVACQGGAGDDGMRPVASEPEPEPTAEPTAEPTPTPEPEPTPTPEPTPEDPYAVPDEIDVAYVQRVIDAIYEVDGDAFRRTFELGDLDHEVIALLTAIYAERAWDSAVRGITQARDDGFSNTRSDPGYIRSTVHEVLAASADCVFFRSSDDFTEVARVAGELQDAPILYLGLAPKNPSDDPDGLNPTPWQVFFTRVWDDPAEVENPCAVRS